MATFHTNYVTGNDTTGDGSVALPFKTINKALSVCANNDTVKVAGGELQAIAGATVTFASGRATSLTTSTDLTGQFSVGDSIFLDTFSTDGYPTAANGSVITAINATTITIANAIMIAPGTYTPYKLSTYHYSAASGTYETFASFTANIVTVEGGWDAGFTTQIGWTGVKTAAINAATNFTSTWNNFTTKSTVVFNRFLFSNIVQAFGGTASAIGCNEVVFNRVQTPFGTSNFGVHAPSSVGFTTLYANNTAINTSWNGAGNKPNTLQIKQWITANTIGVSELKVGFNLSPGQSTGPTIRSLEANWRSFQQAAGVGTFIPLPLNSNNGDVFIDKLNLYVGGGSLTPIFSGGGQANQYRFIGDINATVIGGNASTGITGFQSTIGNSDLNVITSVMNVNRTSGLLEELPWFSTPSTTTGLGTIVNLYGTQRAGIYGRDSQGQKVINVDGIPKFADTTDYVTGSSSIRFKLVTNVTGSSSNILYVCAILNKPSSTATFTVTLKVKASKNITIGNPELVYGPAAVRSSAFTPSTTSVTTSWQDITFTVNPTLLTDWNVGDDGLMQVSIPVSGTVVSNTENAYLWVDSVTVA